MPIGVYQHKLHQGFQKGHIPVAPFKSGSTHPDYIHGHGGNGRDIPESQTHVSWKAMKRRCKDQNAWHFSYYGGRGIRVCDRWMKFENFLADMGIRPDGLTLDRKDTNGNYEPGNCRWATPKEQSNNRRNRRISCAE